MKCSEHIGKFAAAMVKFQGSVTNPKKGHAANAGSYRYEYASLNDIIDHIREPMADAGLAHLQAVSSAEIGGKLCVGVSTRIIHISDEWADSGVAYFPAPKADAQGFGIASTYARRYSLCAALGLFAESDTDGADKRKAAPVAAAKTDQRDPSTVEWMQHFRAAVDRKDAKAVVMREATLEPHLDNLYDDEKKFVANAIRGAKKKLSEQRATA